MWLARPDDAERQLEQLASRTATNVQDDWELAAIELLRGRAESAAPRFRATLARGPPHTPSARHGACLLRLW